MRVYLYVYGLQLAILTITMLKYLYTNKGDQKFFLI